LGVNLVVSVGVERGQGGDAIGCLNILLLVDRRNLLGRLDI